MAAYLYLIPALIGLIVLTYIPLAAVFGLSFFKWGGTGVPEFVGFQNYVRLLTSDPYFKESVKVTIYFSPLAVPSVVFYLFGQRYFVEGSRYDDRWVCSKI